MLEHNYDKARTAIRDFLTDNPNDDAVWKLAQLFVMINGSVSTPHGQESNMADLVTMCVERLLEHEGKIVVPPDQQRTPMLFHGFENQNAIIDIEESKMTNWQVVGIAALGLGVIFLSGWSTKRLS